MKRMSFTNSRWTSLLGKTTALALLMFCFAGLQSLSAQVVITFDKDGDNTCAVEQLDACNGDPKSSSTLFTDDGGNDGNYIDSRVRIDTAEICPIDPWHRVKVVFTKFDLEDQDVLEAYQGDKKAVRAGLMPVGTGSGTGVGNAFGGWIDADCDPAVNESGCLTFILRTDGLNTKGAGWEAWVDCEARDIEFENVNIPNVKLTCDDDPFATIDVAIPDVEMCGENTVASVEWQIKNAHGDVCASGTSNTSGTGAQTTVYTGEFAIGQYAIEYVLASDDTKKGRATFSVQAPALVCNDNVNVPLGSACMVVLTPDDVLEAPCDTSEFLQYRISITIAGAHGFKSITKSGGAGAYPIITVDDLKETGNTVCSATASVTVTRTYYGDRDGDGMPDIPMAVDCNNGTKSASCTTTLSFSDQSIPWIQVAADADTLVACDASKLRELLEVSAIDNCDDDIDVEVNITLDEKDPCFREKGDAGTTEAIVTFTAVDDCGNVGSRTERYTIIRPFEFAKTFDVTASCTSSNVESGTPGIKIGPWKNGMLDPETTDTIDLSTEEYICGYILTKRDIEVPATDCGEKLYRYWSVLDWCTPENGPSAVDTTFIEYIDTEQPFFVDTTDTRMTFLDDDPRASRGFVAKKIATDAKVSLGHFECTFDGNKLPRPVAVDNCDAAPQVSLNQVRWVDEDGILREVVSASNLKCGVYFVRWIAEDICHEQLVNDTAYQRLEVIDDTKPSAVAVDQLNISLPNEWGARICVDDIDAGSYDACGIKSMHIRIKGNAASEWAECIDIGCQYVHPDMQIELRVIDKKGNENIAWTDILVEDKIDPICEDLPYVERFCDEFHNGELGASTDADGDRKFDDAEWTDLSSELLGKYEAYFGVFTCVDNLNSEECGDLERKEQYQLIEWPCGEIEIKRRIVATDWTGNESNYGHQDIKVVYRAGWKFTVPSDWEGTCGDEAIAPELLIDNGACDLLGYEVTSKFFEVPGDACWKMERTYHIINWCKYKAGQEPVEIARVEGEHGFAEGFMITSNGNEDAGYWTYVQVLKVHDDEGPVVTVIDPDGCINGVDFDAAPYGEEDITPGVGPYECDEIKTWTATATDCSDQSVITWKGELWDLNGNMVAESNTNSISYVVTNKSAYFAVFWAFDGCGNSGGAQSEFTTFFWDCKKPTPYAINGVAVELMETGMVSIWASDVDQGSFDNCTDQSKLDLRIWHATLGDAPSDLAGVEALPKVIDFGCNELGTQNVHLYAIDEEGNWDFVQTYVIVQDNMGACTNPDPDGMVAGRIVDGQGELVQSVTLSVNGGDKTMVTEADGQYQFRLIKGGDYTITPQKDMNPLNGVSTFDLVLISKHILGISTFDTPYKYIAADVNKSGSITAFDMVQLRQLILNITSEFPNNDSWRFVAGGYEFTTSNPAAEQFNEFATINNLSGDMMHNDFTAVKIGDVNGSALSNSLLGASSRSVAGSLNLTAVDRFVEAGQTVSVAISGANIGEVSGYQFTLNVAGQASIEAGVAKAANFNASAGERGLIATSWNGTASADEVLFHVTITPNQSGLLSELVGVSSDITAAEAYNNAGELLEVRLNFTGSVATGFDLGQNSPNPFKGETVIGFNLPQAGTATLRVMDVQGKVLQTIEGAYAKGYNQVSVDARTIGATGVLYYQLESADNLATKKMIIIE